MLLDAGAPPNMASESFESPLTLACCGGHDVLVRISYIGMLRMFSGEDAAGCWGVYRRAKR